MRYVYRLLNGKTVELWMSIEEMERRQSKVDGSIKLEDGAIAYRDYAAEGDGYIDITDREIRSDALGCHPDQVDEFSKQAVDIGVPTQFDPHTGQAIFVNRQHRNRYMRALRKGEGPKIFDRDGCYGDPM